MLKFKNIVIALIAVFGIYIGYQCINSGSSNNYHDPPIHNDNDSDGGEMTCPLCKGSRINTYYGITCDCYLCDGKGSLTREQYNYAKNTSDKCVWCNGVGYDMNGDRCRLCLGKGSLTILEYAFRMYGDDMPNPTPNPRPNPGGKTGCPHCAGAGSGNVAGTGICKSCHGTGQTSGYGVQLSACGQCDQRSGGKGNGKCKWCHGTGWR